MFKVGDRIRIKDSCKETFLYLKKGEVYNNCQKCPDIVVCIDTVVGPINYSADYFELSNEKETKMKYVVHEDNNTPVSFPCLRKGSDAGNLYLFGSREGMGVGLDASSGGNKATSARYEDTLPWSGSVTITQ